MAKIAKMKKVAVLQLNFAYDLSLFLYNFEVSR